MNSFNKVTKPYIIICSSKLLEFYITYNKELLHEVRHDIMSNSKTGLSYLPQSSALADDKDMGFDHSNYLEETK